MSGEERPRFSLLFPAFSPAVLLVSSRHSLLVETKLKPSERATVRVCHEDQRQVHTLLYATTALFSDTKLRNATQLSLLWVFEATFNCIHWEALQLGDRARPVESCVPWRFSSHHFIAGKSFTGYVRITWPRVMEWRIEISLLRVIIPLWPRNYSTYFAWCNRYAGN